VRKTSMASWEKTASLINVSGFSERFTAYPVGIPSCPHRTALR
jgi:hypothetical protein